MNPQASKYIYIDGNGVKRPVPQKTIAIITKAIDALSKEIEISATSVADHIRQHLKMSDAEYAQLEETANEVLAQRFNNLESGRGLRKPIAV